MGVNAKLALADEDDPLRRGALSELLRERDIDVVHFESAEADEFVVASMELSVLITDVVLAGNHSGLGRVLINR